MKYTKKDVSFIIVPNSFVTVLDLKIGKTYTLQNNQSNFNVVVEAIKNSEWDNVISSVKPMKAAAVYVKNKIRYENGKVYYGDEELNGVIVKRISQAMESQNKNLSDRLCLFLDKLMLNPSYNSRQQLYNFLEHNNIPITEDGDILTYKKVTDKYLDLHTRTIQNNIWGKEIVMDRNKVDDNPNNHCSSGYHVGDLSFVKDFRSGKIIICKVNPKDIVSVPNDYSCKKVRCCAYTPLCDYEGQLSDVAEDTDKLYAQEDLYYEDDFEVD